MATQRDHPYGNFNFVVDLGDGQESIFSEVDLGPARIDVIEYRTGADPQSEARKLPGRAHEGPATLRRGLTGNLDLYQWWNEVRNGNVNARRTVVVRLLNEARETVAAWKLTRAWPSRLEFGPLRGLGGEVAVEALELTYERLEME